MYENYPKEAMMQTSPNNTIGGVLDFNPTVGENIDSKISILKKEIERLEASKVELAPLMKMRIRDIRDAMNY